MILHHLVTNGYQGTVTRKQRAAPCSPPRQTWTGFTRTENPEVPLSFTLCPLKKAVRGLKNTALIPPGSRSHPFPSPRPSLPCPPHAAAPREPLQAGPGWGPATTATTTCGRRPRPCPERPAGARRPRRRALTAGRSGMGGTRGSEEHRDRRDSRSRSAATAAAVASCFDVSGTVARPAPGALRLRGPHPAPAAGRAGRAGRGAGSAAGAGVLPGIKLAGCVRFQVSLGVWGAHLCSWSVRLGVWGGHCGVREK